MTSVVYYATRELLLNYIVVHLHRSHSCSHLGARFSQTAFDVACKDCDTICNDCAYDAEVPSCTDELDHTTSDGGDTDLTTTEIESGFWRASASSKTILACYNAQACRGGITGDHGYCAEGYEGPCEI